MCIILVRVQLDFRFFALLAFTKIMHFRAIFNIEITFLLKIIPLANIG